MPTKLSSSYTIRFNDCDPFGHLNNARYIDYLLNAREDHLKEFYQVDLRQFTSRGFGWVVSTKFTCINLKTGKKELHSAEFMDFARTMLTPGRDGQGGLRARIDELMKR